MQFKQQLHTLKKGRLSMKDYLNKMKGYVDILTACGHVIFEEDQILYLLGGVGSEYDSVVVHVTSRVDTMTLSDVGALFMSHEGRIDSYSGAGDASPQSVNTSFFSSQKRSRFSSPRFNPRGRGRGKNARGGRRSWSNSNRPVCQICGTPGHVAARCYYRFDKDFVPSHHNSVGYPGYSSNTSSSSQQPVAAAFTTVTSEQVPEEWWYPDSGASHHVTNDLGNLTLGSEYSGGGKVHMGNGSGSSHGGNSSQRDCP